MRHPPTCDDGEDFRLVHTQRGGDADQWRATAESYVEYRTSVLLLDNEPSVKTLLLMMVVPFASSISSLVRLVDVV